VALPGFDRDGLLPPGIHAAPLREVVARFGTGSPAREEKAELLRLVVEAAKDYRTIKRVLVWGSFVTNRPEPRDLDYSIIVSVDYNPDLIAAAHRRFFVPFEARPFYGVDRAYLVVFDYPWGNYIDLLDFTTYSRTLRRCGVVEISIHGEIGESP
jgi:uncharacterized protein DUF6932